MERSRAFCCALLFVAVPLCLARDLAIIVDKSNSVSAVTTHDLQKLFRAGTPKWPDGRKVRVFLTGLGSDDSRMIPQRLYKMTPEELKTFVDSHKPDIEVAGSDELVLKMVANTPGAIGVINVYAINSEVKVIKVDDKLPLEQGYLLHGN